MSGKFITLEGIDGAGKSTHVDWLADFLRRSGLKVRTTREPGGTEFGEKLRHLLLNREHALHPETEALLMFTARREHLDKVILPALEGGVWVLCDRFTDATYAYQSGGSGVPWSRIAALESWVHGACQPDMTIYFDVPPEIGRERSQRIRAPDRFERESGAFYERVRAAYLQRTREAPGRMHAIDAAQGVDEIRTQIKELIVPLLK